jgi:hypothetical protein
VNERLASLRPRLDAWLFRDAPRSTWPAGRIRPAALVLSLLVLAVVLQLLRLGPSTSLDSLWAEDGPIFLQGALFESLGDALKSPYAGYLVIVPRVIAEAASLFPLQDSAAAMSVLAATVVAVSGLAVWYASGGLIRNPYRRAILAALTVLAPVAGLESIDSAAYVGWYMLFATFWLLLWRPRTTLGAALGALFILATGLTTPGVWFFLPLAALRGLAIRSGRDLAIVGSYAVGAAVQIPVVAGNQAETIDPSWSNEIWVAYGQRVVDGAVFGQELGGSIWSLLGAPFLVVLALGAATLLVVLLRDSGPTGRLLAAIALPTSLVLFVVSVYQRAVGGAMGWGIGSFTGSGGRYAIVPALLLVSAALVLVEDSRRSAGSSWLSLGISALLLLSIVTSFPQGDNDHRGGPAWEGALKMAASSCRSEGLTETAVPIAPPPFGVQVPCDRLSALAQTHTARQAGP